MTAPHGRLMGKGTPRGPVAAPRAPSRLGARRGPHAASACPLFSASINASSSAVKLALVMRPASVIFLMMESEAHSGGAF